MAKAATILLVEDSPTQAQKMVAVLSTLYGFQVMVASDGIEGLRMASDLHPDIIVLDVNLPKMDGFQVCKRLKRDNNTAHIPIIMLTSSDSSDSAMTGLDSGADDYIPKDAFATENLIATLRNYLTFS